MATGQPHFALELGDILEFEADVVVFKHAQAFWGADRRAATALTDRGAASEQQLSVSPNRHVFIDTLGALRAPVALFVGLPQLWDFDYEDLHRFGARAVQAVSRERPDAEHLAMTIHGPGFGLDEIESFIALVRGAATAFPDLSSSKLRRVSFVEVDRGRVRRLGRALRDLLETEDEPAEVSTEDETAWDYRIEANTRASAELLGPGEAKRHLFVAMPYDRELDDLFHYGIQSAIRESGFTCARIDQRAFVGDVLDHIKQKIETSAGVVAELSGSNPNVFLEIGYAWGRGRPTVLLLPSNEQLQFDVRGQKCLKYESIRDAELVLTNELSKLKQEGLLL